MSERARTWKSSDKWDEKIPTDIFPTQGTSLELLDSKDLLDKLKIKIAAALLDPNIKPYKWKDILETLQFLSLGTETKNKKNSKNEKDITSLNDKELDLEIEQLKRLAGQDETEAEIVVPKRDIVDIE